MIPGAPGTTEPHRYAPGTSGGPVELLRRVAVHEQTIARLLVLLEDVSATLAPHRLDSDAVFYLHERIERELRAAELAGF